MGDQPHALVVPYPAQGHVIPLLELSYCLVDHGFKITFVNTDFSHARLLAAMSPEQENMTDRIRLVSVPDGLSAGEDRNDLKKLTDALTKAVPPRLEEVIRKSNEPGEDKITCMIADGNLAWVLQVARKTGLRSTEFWPTAAATVVTELEIPKLIRDGVIDADGVPIKETFELAPGLPPMNAAHLPWNCFHDAGTRRMFFHYMSENNQFMRFADIVICNSFEEIEQPVIAHAPNIRPIGPLLTGERLGKPVGHFWPEDANCTTWLDGQPVNSVVYVAFGSHAVFSRLQFKELALGLELCNRPFFWVVRPDLTGDPAAQVYAQSFRERVGSRGRMVSWAPQQKLLAHPAVACFITHCGWNSTLEGLRNGVPFLCWPYFGDQFLNRNYICGIWRIGFELTSDESGIVRKEEIRSKVEELTMDEGIKQRTQVMKERACKSVQEGGTSAENLQRFIDVMNA